MNYDIQLGELYQHIRNRYYYVYLLEIITESTDKTKCDIVKAIRIYDLDGPGTENAVNTYPVDYVRDSFELVGDR